MPDLFGRSGLITSSFRAGGGFQTAVTKPRYFGAESGIGLKTRGIKSLLNVGKGKFLNITVDMFFDRQSIIQRMDAKTAKVLGSTGALTRRYMQTNMRYRKSVSAPGAFPSAHKPTPYLRQFILFGFDIADKSLVVGPRLLSNSDKEVLAMGKTVPQLVNEGGLVVRRRLFDPKRKKGPKFRPIKGPTVVHRYRPRPFVALTLPYASQTLADQMFKFNL